MSAVTVVIVVDVAGWLAGWLTPSFHSSRSCIEQEQAVATAAA